jgi:maleate cis-trans isomerase
LNRLIRDFLGPFDLVATSPGETLQHYTDALKMTPGDVIAYARWAIAEQNQVDAIYFQGAVLDPMDCLEQMERELNLPVVASNPAMNWYMLSKLGIKHPLPGFGKLLASWPALGERIMAEAESAGEKIKTESETCLGAEVSLFFRSHLRFPLSFPP